MFMPLVYDVRFFSTSKYIKMPTKIRYINLITLHLAILQKRTLIKRRFSRWASY